MVNNMVSSLWQLKANPPRLTYRRNPAAQVEASKGLRGFGLMGSRVQGSGPNV